MSNFNELDISESLLKAIEELGFDEPTEIQEKTIPPILEGKDIIAGSATGSGKTLAFGAGILDRMEAGPGVKALILTPTRELAEQILTFFNKFTKYMPLKICSIYGGVSINPQFKALETADVVVGTPGRILDHLERRTLDLKSVKHLVLDEADRMLDMGFLEDVNKIIGQCPQDKQTLLFSATITPDIESISDNFMKSPVKISVSTQVDPRKLRQVYYDVKTNLKLSLLVHLLKDEHGLVMVFCNSRKYTDIVAKSLNKNGVEAMSIHGGLSQYKRNQILKKFHSGDDFILACTDVAARGLDIPDVSHVYNYDLPDDSKQYIHRIGRTARAGKSGKVVNLLCDRDHENFSRILRDYDVKILKVEMPKVPRAEIAGLDRNRRRGPGGRGGPGGGNRRFGPRPGKGRARG